MQHVTEWEQGTIKKKIAGMKTVKMLLQIDMLFAVIEWGPAGVWLTLPVSSSQRAVCVSRHEIKSKCGFMSPSFLISTMPFCSLWTHLIIYTCCWLTLEMQMCTSYIVHLERFNHIFWRAWKIIIIFNSVSLSNMSSKDMKIAHFGIKSIKLKKIKFPYEVFFFYH